ncbi:hypothetical protein [Couchioplanes caeruleus]|uniref:Uncharacterized protein n=2 Tax=Couchioplanes caeruleus TaxID=56438 RepID=A0A1K0FEY9_9ACTN|nr:hypothetical protein [Couchioplanes caeruleus]OJF11304.1 hypothetical protein BG844_27095 [Couchioplanes caeruleus subsp. caeruleus]ROP32182.1 hypothetical protein EDD30_5117 [Couchioplanes caeruleus]
MSGTGTSVLAEIIGEVPRRPSEPPAAGDMTTILAAARHRAGPPLRIRRHDSDEGPAYWRWDCASCGEYGGGRHHPDAVSRAMRHCAEHPEHGSSLLPPARCRERDHRLAVHPMLFAMDDDPPPPPLAV